MKTIEQSIEVAQPLTVVYNQWTQFEDFPEFMAGVKEVRQLDSRILYWRAEVGGKIEEWTAEIFDQVADDHIAWRSLTGAKNSGVVRFEEIDSGKTRVTVRVYYEPEGATETIGDTLGLLRVRVARDLERFKEFIEHRHAPTGGWRGEIHGQTVSPPAMDRGDAFVE